MEAPVAALHDVVVPLVAVLLALALAADRQHVAVDADVELLRLHAGQVGAQTELAVFLVHVDARRAHRHAALARAATAAAEGFVEGAIDLALKLGERVAEPLARSRPRSQITICHGRPPERMGPWRGIRRAREAGGGSGSSCVHRRRQSDPK